MFKITRRRPKITITQVLAADRAAAQAMINSTASRLSQA